MESEIHASTAAATHEAAALQCEAAAHAESRRLARSWGSCTRIIGSWWAYWARLAWRGVACGTVYTAAFEALKVGGPTQVVGPRPEQGLEMVDVALGMAPQPMRELARVRANRRQTGFREWK
jgi:hypothetical protein